VSNDKPLVLGFMPVRVAQAAVVAILGLGIVTMILDASGVWPEPPDTINLAFMAVLSPLLGGLVGARKDQGPPAEERAARQAEQTEKSRGTNE
jgi:hypothetical protein